MPPNRYFGIDLFNVKINLKDLNQVIFLKNSITKPLFALLIFAPFAFIMTYPIIKIQLPKIINKINTPESGIIIFLFLFAMTTIAATLHFLIEIYTKISSSATIIINESNIKIIIVKNFIQKDVLDLNLLDIKNIEMKTSKYKETNRSKIQTFQIVELVHPKIRIPIYVQEGETVPKSYFHEAKAMLKFYRETPEAMQQ